MSAPTPAPEISQDAARLETLQCEFERFMDICTEGGAHGRACDLISGTDWKRAIRAIAAATRAEGGGA